MRSLTQALACAGLILAASHASAAVINLEPPDEPGLGNVYTQDGYTFTNSYADRFSYINPEAYPGFVIYDADYPGTDLIANYYGSTNTLTKVGGGAFNFFGLSLAAAYNTALGGDVAFTFNHADGTSTAQTVSLAMRSGLQAFSFNETDLTSVVFTTTDATSGQLPEIQFDYAVVGDISAVPLPASLPLFGAALLGLAGVGYGIRRTGRPAVDNAAATA